MRQFSTDSPDLFVFQLDGKTYEIPTAASMPIKMLEEMSKADERGEGFMWQVKMLRKYMGKVVDDIPAGVASDILKAWSDTTSESGAEVGE